MESDFSYCLTSECHLKLNVKLLNIYGAFFNDILISAQVKSDNKPIGLPRQTNYVSNDINQNLNFNVSIDELPLEARIVFEIWLFVFNEGTDFIDLHL